MPTSEDILGGLTTIANDWRLLATLWHGYFSVLVLGLICNRRPTRRITGMLLNLPLFSVSALAWIHGNPFNGTIFALAGVGLLGISLRLPREDAVLSSGWLAVAGICMIVFGWVYPHFLNDTALVAYLWSAPTGLVPCPTLSIVVGFTLLLGGLGSRAWCLVLSAVSLFYGAFGAIRLGVGIDWALFLGALATVYTAYCRELQGNGHVDSTR